MNNENNGNHQAKTNIQIIYEKVLESGSRKYSSTLLCYPTNVDRIKCSLYMTTLEIYNKLTQVENLKNLSQETLLI